MRQEVFECPPIKKNSLANNFLKFGDFKKHFKKLKIPKII